MMLIKKLALMMVSLAFTLLTLEGGMRLVGFSPIYDVYSKPSIFWESDPLLGWTHTPNSTAVFRGPRPWPIEFETEVHINSLGLRGPELDDLTEGGLRVLLSGDSMTAGFEVPFEATYSFLLEKGLGEKFNRPVQAINAGVRGYGTDQSYLAYIQKWRDLKPEVVVFMHSANDARNNITLHRMRRLFGKSAASLDGEGNILLRDEEVKRYPICSAYRMNAGFSVVQLDSAASRTMCVIQMTLFDHSALFTIASQIIRQNPKLVTALYHLGQPAKKDLVDEVAADDKTKFDYKLRLTEALILRFAKDVERDGGNFVLAMPEKEFQLMPLDKIRAAGIPIIRPIPVVNRNSNHPDPLPIGFKRDSHFNSYGHSLIAESMAEQVSTALPHLIARPHQARVGTADLSRDFGKQVDRASHVKPRTREPAQSSG